MIKHPKAVALVGTCPHCGEAVEMIMTKKEAKAIYKGFQAGSPREANLIGEIMLKKVRKKDAR